MSKKKINGYHYGTDKSSWKVWAEKGYAKLLDFGWFRAFTKVIYFVVSSFKDKDEKE